MKHVAAIACMALIGACASEGPVTELVLVADTNLPLDRIVFSVRDQHGKMREAEALPSDALPATLSIVRRHADPGVLFVSAQGYTGSALSVQRDAEVSFVSGETRVVPLHLLAACEAVHCGASDSCTEAGCTPRALDAEALPRWTGRAPGLMAPSDGGVGSDATQPDGTLPDASEPGDADPADPDSSMPDPVMPDPPAICLPACVLADGVKHAVAACIDGVCGFSCEPDRGDCNGDPSDGCELKLSDETACGGCEIVCLATEKCKDLVCVLD